MLPFVSAVFTACSSTPKDRASTVIAQQEGVPGGVVLKTFKTTATVTAIDYATRRYTLKREDGKESSFTAGPEVVNFGQVKVGDVVQAIQTEEFAVSLRKSDAPLGSAQASTVTLAPEGGKPGMQVARTREITARVWTVSEKKREATLQFADGKLATYKLGAHVKLANIKTNDEVLVELTESVTLKVVSP